MESAFGQAALMLASGAVTGVLGAILGIGGGVFLIPILVLVLDVPMRHAVATSILSVVATSSAVASTNVERGTANMRLGMTLEIATALGAITGGITAHWLSPKALEALFGFVLMPVAVFMWRGPSGSRAQNQEPGPDEELGALGARFDDPARRRTVAYRVRRLWAGLGISFVAGNLSGLLGIGGGVFKVPALHLLCGVPIKAAAATSNFMIGVTATASAFLYYGKGEILPTLTATTILGVLAGSAVGSMLNRYIAGHAVRRLFAALVVLMAIQMLIRSWNQGW